MQDCQLEDKSDCQVLKPHIEQSKSNIPSVSDAAKPDTTASIQKKALILPQNGESITTTSHIPNPGYESHDAATISKTTNNNNNSTTETSAKPISIAALPSKKPVSTAQNKPITKPISQPTIMPKHINTPDGTILLTSPANDNKTQKITKQMQPTNKDAAINNANDKKLHGVHVKSKIVTPPPPSSTTQNASVLPDMTRSASVQGTKSIANPYQTMQRTSSVPIAKTTASAAAKPIALAPSPSSSQQNAGVHFHPIAIKPRPIQPLPPKIRSKANLLPRPTNLHPSKDPMKASDNSITLTTSKNWVLPPRPKTKKSTKKKEKKPIPRVSSPNMDMKFNGSTSPKASSMASISKTVSSSKKVSSPLSNQIDINSNTPSPNASHISTHSSPARLSKSNHDIPKNPNTNKSKSSESKDNECAGCTRCVAPGIRSVYLEPSTGKVSINAQIHSNINLYTNDQGELEVQLQHVTRENDNLKKILLKLNKEIQNLKLVKKKEENSALRDGKSKDIKAQSLNRKNSSIKSKLETTPIPKQPIVVKKEDDEMDVDMDMFNDVPPATPQTRPIQVKKENEEELLFDTTAMKSSANTIDPVNLSYNLESKRQKISSTSPDVLSANSMRPSLAQSEMDIDSIPSTPTATTKSKVKKPVEKTRTKPKPKVRSPAVEEPKVTPAPTAVTVKTEPDTISVSPIVKKEYHSCGVCEVGQKCVCFDSQTLSIATTIAQALSHGGVNLLGLGSLNNSTINQVGKCNVNGLNTLKAILKREEIMKKLKDDDKKTLTNILKNESAKTSTSKDDKASLNTILNGLNNASKSKSSSTASNPAFATENLCGINTMTDAAMTEMKNNMLRNAKAKSGKVKVDINNKNLTTTTNNVHHDDDDELLQMIDAELLLDPTPIVNPILLKKDRSSIGNLNNMSVLKSVSALSNDNNDPSLSSGMKRSESKNSQHSLGTNNEFFGRGTLMDFNAFNGGDPMIEDDAILFDTTSYGGGVTTTNNIGGDLTVDIDKILMEPVVDDADEFMIY